MITFKELLQNHNLSDIPINHQHNLEILLERINKVRSAYGVAMTVTSCYRSEQEHRNIYSRRGIMNPPMGSQHLIGGAVDILDTDDSLMQWCRDNVPILEEAQLWCEDDPSQKRVHFQIYPPKSGNRFFKP